MEASHRASSGPEAVGSYPGAYIPAARRKDPPRCAMSVPLQPLPSSNDGQGMTSAERIMRARLAAHVQWSKTSDPTARTAAARRAFLDRFEREVDPEGTLPPEERHRRAEHARRAHFTRLALASARARRRTRRQKRALGGDAA
jgi:hypothetical protein